MTEWIHVTEDLPKAFEPCWIYFQDKQVVIGCRTYEPDQYEPTEGWYEYENKCRWANYWMPIEKPKPPTSD